MSKKNKVKEVKETKEEIIANDISAEVEAEFFEPEVTNIEILKSMKVSLKSLIHTNREVLMAVESAVSSIDKAIKFVTILEKAIVDAEKEKRK